MWYYLYESIGPVKLNWVQLMGLLSELCNTQSCDSHNVPIWLYSHHRLCHHVLGVASLFTVYEAAPGFVSVWHHHYSLSSFRKLLNNHQLWKHHWNQILLFHTFHCWIISYILQRCTAVPLMQPAQTRLSDRKIATLLLNIILNAVSPIHIKQKDLVKMTHSKYGNTQKRTVWSIVIDIFKVLKYCLWIWGTFYCVTWTCIKGCLLVLVLFVCTLAFLFTQALFITSTPIESQSETWFSSRRKRKRKKRNLIQIPLTL